MRKLFPLADVLRFRRDNAEISGRYAAMDVKALTSEREEMLSNASISAFEMDEAKRRMNNYLERAEELREQIEALRAPEVSRD